MLSELPNQSHLNPNTGLQYLFFFGEADGAANFLLFLNNKNINSWLLC